MIPASKENNYLYNKSLKERAKSLRKTGSMGEKCMWKYLLSSGQVRGYTFLRQRPVMHYIVDFMCKDLMLIIEVDGKLHQDIEIYPNDKERQNKLEEVGFKVIRFSDWEVINRLGSVSEEILVYIDEFEMESKK